MSVADQVQNISYLPLWTREFVPGATVLCSTLCGTVRVGLGLVCFLPPPLGAIRVHLSPSGPDFFIIIFNTEKG